MGFNWNENIKDIPFGTPPEKKRIKVEVGWNWVVCELYKNDAMILIDILKRNKISYSDVSDNLENS